MVNIFFFVIYNLSILDTLKSKDVQMPEKKIESAEPLKAAMAIMPKENLERIKNLKIAKKFANIGKPLVGFEGYDRHNKYFELRVDYDPDKGAHVNVTIDGDDTYAFIGKTYDWYIQVINNINGGSYCDIPRVNNTYDAEGKQQDPACIKGMKKYMERY